ncbi:unnamed protein product [Lupinus luteus]|uniref:F-box domain-containing protein n=1 Tax=Lupinus luteus TaxID=3873 RepID=A0AAV1XH86_LUPLU
MEEKSMKFDPLPEGCIALILSRTTPIDTCNLSLVSTEFYSASKSDVSFQLDKKSGKKCYMLGARALSIAWGDTHCYWEWTNMPDSRFFEVAKLKIVCWLEIRGVLNTNALSPNTHYVAYFVFKMINSYGFNICLVELSIDIFGDQISNKNVCLNLNAEEEPDYDFEEEEIMDLRERMQGLQLPNVRSDGWLEIEIENFFNSGLEDKEVLMSVMEIKIGHSKKGLIIEGIEVRPKDAN